ncbi:MAG: DUF402 domain-containing protein [Fervidicoccaceae archaeon]
MSSEEKPPGAAAVRVRGIYSTAISKFLLDRGFRIAQPSPKIVERLKLERADHELADVTIKELDDDKSRLLVLGHPRAFDDVLRALLELLEGSFVRVSELQRYSTVAVEVIGGERGSCVAASGGARLLLDTGSCVPGKLVKASIIKAPIFPSDQAVAREGFSVLKRTLVLTSWRELSFSEHIKSRSRRDELTQLSAEVLRAGLGVRWRSSAGVAPIEVVKSELSEALEEAKRLSPALPERGAVLSPGEKIALLTLSSVDRKSLDELRSSAIPTASFHHTLKMQGLAGGAMADLADELVERGLDGELVGLAALELSLEKLLERQSIELRHYTPEGEVIRIGPARPSRLARTKKGPVLLLERRARSAGTYDGIGARREPGDLMLTACPLGAWFSLHAYFGADEKLKGLYLNVNTPAEPLEDSIAYLDLQIDVVKRPGEAPDVIDREKLEEAASRGLLGERLRARALEVSEEAASALSKSEDPRSPSDLLGLLEALSERERLFGFKLSSGKR